MAESNIYHGQTKLDSSPHMITNPIKQGTYFARVHFFGRILFRFNSPNHHLLRLCCQKNPELVSTKINVAWFPHWLMTMVLPVASMQQNTAFGKTSPAASATESQARCVFSVNRLLCIQSLIWLITKTINSFIHVARNIQSWWANEYFGLWSVHDTGEVKWPLQLHLFTDKGVCLPSVDWFAFVLLCQFDSQKWSFLQMSLKKTWYQYLREMCDTVHRFQPSCSRDEY